MSTDIYHVNVRFILLPSSYSFNTLIAERDDKFLKMGWGVRHEHGQVSTHVLNCGDAPFTSGEQSLIYT